MIEANVHNGLPFSGLGFDLAPVRRVAMRMRLIEAKQPGVVRLDRAADTLPVAWGYDLMLLHGQETGAS